MTARKETESIFKKIFKYFYGRLPANSDTIKKRERLSTNPALKFRIPTLLKHRNMKPDAALLEKLCEDVELCYQRSNSFTDEHREYLLAGAKSLSSAQATVRRP